MVTFVSPLTSRKKSSKNIYTYHIKTQRILYPKGDFVSFVSENVMLYGNFSAFQNINYFAKLAGKRNLTRTDYASVMKRVGLQEGVVDDFLSR